MFDSKEELLDKIALGEDTVLELKAVRFDEQVVATATIDDLDRPLYERFRGPQSRDTDGDLLHKLAMARPDDQGQLRPTVAGVLLATREPRNIQAVAYRGVSVVPDADAPSYQLDAADISGPRDAQVIDACHFVRKNMWVAAAKTAKAMGRRDLPQFDMVTVFEAVVNAVAHRLFDLHLQDPVADVRRPARDQLTGCTREHDECREPRLQTVRAQRSSLELARQVRRSRRPVPRDDEGGDSPPFIKQFLRKSCRLRDWPWLGGWGGRR